MPRARKARLSDDVRAELFARWHIRDMEISHADGVTQVKHAMLGWMSAEDYYRLQKIHDALPFLEKVVEGGYRLKAALWGIDISFGVLATGTEFPLGMALIAGALGLAAIDEAAGRRDLATLDLLSLVLPFGEIYLFARGAVIFTEAVQSSVDRTVSNLEFFEEKGAEVQTRARAIDWRRVIWPFPFP